MSQKIFLIGLPGSGKTTMGLELGLYLTIPFIDLDQEIERSTGQSIPSIFENEGEAQFRQIEKKQLQNVSESIPTFVMATGGGTPCFFNNIDFMNEHGSTVFINTPIKTIKERLEKDSTRPLMRTNSLEELLSKRKDWYQEAKHQIVTMEDLFNIYS